jgi:hypothetical protein
MNDDLRRIFLASKEYAGLQLGIQKFQKNYPGSSPQISYVERLLDSGGFLTKVVGVYGLNGASMEAVIKGAIEGVLEHHI